MEQVLEKFSDMVKLNTLQGRRSRSSLRFPCLLDRVRDEAVQRTVRVDSPHPGVRPIGHALDGLLKPVGKDHRLAAASHAADQSRLAVHVVAAQPLLFRTHHRPQRLPQCDLTAEQVGVGSDLRINR